MWYFEYKNKTAAVLIMIVLCVPVLFGCNTIKQFTVKTDNVLNARHQLTKFFQKNEPTLYKLNYIQQKNHLVISSVTDVYVLDLNTGDYFKGIKEPTSSVVTYTHVSRSGDYFYQFTSKKIIVYDTNNWKIIKILDAGTQNNQISGFSNSEDLVYFAGAVWVSDTFEKKSDLSEFTLNPTDFDFSPDNKTLLVSGVVVDAILFDYINNSYIDMSYDKGGTSQVSFRDEASFYASYGATFDITKGGYLPETLGLFNIDDNTFTSKFSPHEKISCWVHDDEYGLLVALLNGDIYLLDHLLDIKSKWHINDYIKTCSQGANGDIWLGSIKTGVYKASITEKIISHEYLTDKTIDSVEASSDGRYLAVSEVMHGQAEVTVFTVH